MKIIFFLLLALGISTSGFADGVYVSNLFELAASGGTIDATGGSNWASVDVYGPLMFNFTATLNSDGSTNVTTSQTTIIQDPSTGTFVSSANSYTGWMSADMKSGTVTIVDWSQPVTQTIDLNFSTTDPTNGTSVVVQSTVGLDAAGNTVRVNGSWSYNATPGNETDPFTGGVPVLGFSNSLVNSVE